MAIIKTVSRVSRFEREFSPVSRDSISSSEDERQCQHSESESDEHADEVDDADSAAGSDDIDLSELGEVGEEFCQVGNENCSIPFELYDLPGLGDILSVDSWNNCLTEEDRFSLAKYLPDMDGVTFMHTLNELFLGTSFHFGSPIVKLFHMLRGGLCEPRVSLYQQGLNFIQKREYYHHLGKYHNSMVGRLIQVRDAWENCKGYSIGMKLRVLNMKRSKRSLMSLNMVDLSPETDSSGSEESEDGFWDKRLKDIKPKFKMGRQAVYQRSPTFRTSRGRAVVPEPAKYGKKNSKGLMKVVQSNVPLTNKIASPLPPMQYGAGTKPKSYGSGLVLPQKDYGVGHDLETHQKTRNKSRGEDDVEKSAYEITVKGDLDSTFGDAMSKIGLQKQGRQQEFFKREDDHPTASFKGFPFSLNNDSLHSHGKNRDINSMANVLDKHQHSALGDQMNTVSNRAQHMLLKDMKVDWSGRSQAVQTKKTKESFPVYKQVGSDEWDIRNKRGKKSLERQPGASIVPSLKGKSHTTLAPTSMGTFLQRSNYEGKMSQDGIRKKFVQSRGLDLEGLGGMSAFIKNDETESDSSDQVDEDEEDKSLRSAFGRPIGTLQDRQFSPVNSLSDPKKEIHIERKVNEDYAPEKVMYSSQKVNCYGKQMTPALIHSSKGKQKGKLRDLSYLPNLALDDRQQFQKSVRKSHMQGELGERMQFPFSIAYPADGKRKGKDDHSYFIPQSNYMQNCDSEEFDDLQSIPRLVDDHETIKGLVKKGRTNATLVIDHHGRPNMSLLGCNAATRKRKGKADLTNMDELDEAEYLYSSPPQPVTDSSSKKHGNAISEALVSEGPADLGPETKLIKKPFTLITPTVHTGFSFSVIHLLSAVRMVLITPIAEDASKVGKSFETSNEKHDPLREEQNKDHAANGSPLRISGHMEQKILPSLTIQEIVSLVRLKPGDPFILETQEPLQDLVRGVLKIFLSKTAPLGAKGWKALVSYEKATKHWTWIGPVSSNVSDTYTFEEEVSSEAWDLPHKMLVKLVDSFANWLKSGQETLQQIGSLPPPPMTLMQLNLDEKERFRDSRAQKSLPTISPSSEEVKAYFRREEVLRYLVPDRAFQYTAADGKKSIVAPLRRCGGKPNSKARDHYMLKPDRPPHVTVLCLVRDAAARLPGSIGSRADVCTLIRDSQYIVEDVSDEKLTRVVSGALDRLHYEVDPCVQFDAERKLWVYLHRDREEEDFEDDGTASTKKWKRQRKDSTEQPDPDETEEQMVGGSGGGFGLNTDLNIEPSPMHEDEVVEPL